MYSDDDLNAAVAEGALSAEAAARLRAFVAGRQAAPSADEEHFRLLTGFNDIFVAIAAILILVAVGWLGAVSGQIFGSGIALAGASWALAEYFTRKRRMALPSIVLLLGFVGGMAVVGLGLAGATSVLQKGGSHNVQAICAALGAAAACAHWFRFKVPITIAAGASAAVWLILSLLLAAMPDLSGDEMQLRLIGGLGVFALAMWWDMSDRERTTRRSDVAFWLHLTAAPLIVHPIFNLLGVLGRSGTDLGRAGIAVAIYFLLALIAVIVDRRALLVSALLYVLYATAALLRAVGSASTSFALTALVIGAALLLLSAFWNPARRIVVGQLPASFRARLPAV